MRTTTCIAVLMTLITCVGPSAALELWVDRDSLGGPCDDGRAREEVAEDAPWCTLGVAGSNVQPGDIVHVRAGHYTEIQTCGVCNDNSVLQLAVSGEQDAWIRFLAAEGESVIVSGAGGATHGVQVIETYDESVYPRYVEVSGFEIHDVPGNCVAVKRTSDVVFRHLEVWSCGGGAVELHETDRVTLEASLIHDNLMTGWTSAVDLYLCGSGNEVRGNYIWGSFDEDPLDSEGHGITMDTCGAAGGALIENNVIFENEGWCMAIYESDGAVIRNNTCWANGLRPGAGEISILGEHHAVHNNVLLPRQDVLALNIRERNDYPVDFDTIEADYNLLWAPTHDVVAGWGLGNSGTVAEYQAQNPGSWGANTLQADPLLVDPEEYEFQLSEGSPAIDSGDDAHAPEQDVSGAPRPWDGDGDDLAVVDRGAFEFGSTPSDGDIDADIDADADSDTDTDSDADGDSDADAGDGANADDDSSCGCSAVGRGSRAGLLAWLSRVV